MAERALSMLRIFSSFLYLVFTLVAGILLSGLIPVFVPGMTASANAALQYEQASDTTIGRSKTKLEVMVQTGPDKEAWTNKWVDAHVPQRLQLRWQTQYSSVGAVEWEISETLQPWKSIQRGDAVPNKQGKSGGFTLNLQQAVNAPQHRPQQYYLRVVTYKANPPQLSTSSGRQRMGTKANTDQRRDLKAKQDRPPISRRSQAGLPSNIIPLTLLEPGEMTQFTFRGLNPELVSSMPIEIQLEELTIKGEGGDEDPYLFVVAVFADGSTVIPELDGENVSITFQSASVRLRSPTQTHENVAGANVDVGVTFPIPASTGYFRETIRPIGAQFFNILPLSAGERETLRQHTYVGLVVIGMEEDAIPSTDAIDATRDDILNTLQQELDGLVRSVQLDQANPTELPDLEQAARDIAAKIRPTLIDRAMERGLDEFAENFRFLGFPSVIIVPGAMNADDYIGSRTALFSYEDILNAGERGIAIDMQLNQKWDGLPRYLQADSTESIWYHVKGRVRIAP